VGGWEAGWKRAAEIFSSLGVSPPQPLVGALITDIELPLVAAADKNGWMT